MNDQDGHLAATLFGGGLPAAEMACFRRARLILD